MPGCLGRTRPPQAPPRACYCIVLIDHILYILYYRIDQSAGDEAESQLLKASKQDGSLLWSALRVSAMAKMWIFEHDIFAQYKRNTYDFFRRNKLDTNTCTFFLAKTLLAEKLLVQISNEKSSLRKQFKSCSLRWPIRDILLP